MPRVEQSILVNVPVERAYELVADEPERMVEWWPPIELQARLTPPPTAIGSISRYVYNMLGVKIKGEHKVRSMQRNEWLQVQTTSGLDSMFDFRFAACGPALTQVTVVVDYRLPGSVLGQLLNKALVEGENIRNLETGLLNLKRLLEMSGGDALS